MGSSTFSVERWFSLLRKPIAEFRLLISDFRSSRSQKSTIITRISATPGPLKTWRNPDCGRGNELPRWGETPSSRSSQETRDHKKNYFSSHCSILGIPSHFVGRRLDRVSPHLRDARRRTSVPLILSGPKGPIRLMVRRRSRHLV